MTSIRLRLLKTLIVPILLINLARRRFSGRSPLLTENQIKPTQASAINTSSSTSPRTMACRICTCLFDAWSAATRPAGAAGPAPACAGGRPRAGASDWLWSKAICAGNHASM